MIICAGRNESFPHLPTQLVLVWLKVAINLTRMCLFDKPEFLLFIGSAGSYGNHQILILLNQKELQI